MLELVDERVDPDRTAVVRAFAREYMRRVEGEARGEDAEALFNETLGVFELAASRDGAPVAVRAFNPVPAEHGYATRGAVLETNTEDLPFLVDSVSAELETRGIGMVRIVHPVIGTERDGRGRIVAVRHPRDASATESVMHFELDRTLGPDELAALEDATRVVIEDVRRVVRDHAAMRLRMNEMIDRAKAAEDHYDEEEVAETVAFLRWLLDERFIFLGARDYEVSDGKIRVVHGSGLGLLADCDDSAYADPVDLDTLEPELRERVEHGELLIVSKSNRLSPVHRRARMDYIGVRRIASDGSTAGESRMLGLFTTKAYAEPASQSPLLGRKLRAVLAAEDLIEGSHDYKAAVSLFDSFPKDELLAAPVEDLRAAVVALLGGAGPDRVRVLGRRHPHGRGASVIVDLPKPRYDADQHERVRALLAARAGARRRASTPPRSSACATSSPPAPARAASIRTRSSARASGCSCTSPPMRPTGSASSTSTRCSTTSPTSRARGTTARARRSSPPTASAGGCSPRAGPSACPRRTRPLSTRPPPRATSRPSSGCSRPAGRSSSPCATRAS